MVVVSNQLNSNTMCEVKIVRATSCDSATAEAITQLLAQLTPTPHHFTEREFSEVISDPSSALFLLWEGCKVVGMLTVGAYLSPTGRKLWIEDVVVDNAFRGRSYGRRLVEHAISCASEQGGTLMLTSKPSRVAANALYRSAGFQPKETNVYRFPLPAKE